MRPLLASEVAFGVIFGIFVVALVVLIVVTLTWAIRRDKAGRAAWRDRQIARGVTAPPARGLRARPVPGAGAPPGRPGPDGAAPPSGTQRPGPPQP